VVSTNMESFLQVFNGLYSLTFYWCCLCISFSLLRSDSLPPSEVGEYFYSPLYVYDALHHICKDCGWIVYLCIFIVAVVILRNCFCSQLWFYIFYLCNLFRKVIYWRRRHVGSGSYKEGCCREKERGWQIWWSRVEIWSEIDITPGNWSIGMMPFG